MDTNQKKNLAVIAGAAIIIGLAYRGGLLQTGAGESQGGMIPTISDYGVGKAYPQQDGDAGAPTYVLGGETVSFPAPAAMDLSQLLQKPETTPTKKESITVGGTSYPVTAYGTKQVGGQTYQTVTSPGAHAAVQAALTSPMGYVGTDVRASKKESVTPSTGVSGGGAVQSTPASSIAAAVRSSPAPSVAKAGSPVYSVGGKSVSKKAFMASLK
jgi:hypothetical protein